MWKLSAPVLALALLVALRQAWPWLWWFWLFLFIGWLSYKLGMASGNVPELEIGCPRNFQFCSVSLKTNIVMPRILVGVGVKGAVGAGSVDDLL